jgi:hypothetical protein
MEVPHVTPKKVCGLTRDTYGCVPFRVPRSHWPHFATIRDTCPSTLHTFHWHRRAKNCPRPSYWGGLGAGRPGREAARSAPRPPLVLGLGDIWFREKPWLARGIYGRQKWATRLKGHYTRLKGHDDIEPIRGLPHDGGLQNGHPMPP